MNFKFQILNSILIFLLPFFFNAQTSWHINEIEVCKYDLELKKWVDCVEEDEKTVFYFSEGLTKISMIDWDNKIRYFDVNEVKPFDEEKNEIEFEVVNSSGRDFTLIINFELKFITIFDFNDRDDWTLMRFSYEDSVAYGNFISKEIEISDWDYQKDKYVNVSEDLSWEFYVDIDFNSLILENKNQASSKINIGMEYSEFDSKNNWLLFKSTSSEEMKIYAFNSDSGISSLLIYTDLVNGRYQKLMSLFNLEEIENSEKVSKGNSTQDEKSQSWTGTGSGIIFSTDGYIATNYHVIENANEIEVEFKNRGKIRKFNAEVIKSDPTNDLAILKINDDSFEELPSLLYNLKTKTSDIGQSVFALGYPKSNIMGTDLKFTDGKISSRTGAMGDVTNYQTTTPIQSGNSGGPLFDTDGNLIAINSSKMVAEDIDNVSYSIKTIYLIPLIDALPENITLPNSRFLEGKDFTEQFKVLEKYVTLIRVK